MELHKTIVFEGHTIHYRDEGRQNNPTLVLLHGFMQNMDIWISYVLAYLRSMRVITIDLPGHGYSDCLGKVQTMDQMAEAVKKVLDAACVTQCVMVGHSLGGYVALAFADSYPHYLRGLGLIHSHALADSEETRKYRKDVCLQVEQNRPGYILSFVPLLFAPCNRFRLEMEIKDLQDQCLDTRPESIISVQAGLAERPSRMSVLQQLEVPILFVYGKQDPRIPVEVGIAQALIAHHAEIMLLDNVAHMAHLEEQDYLKPRLQHFVETCYL